MGTHYPRVSPGGQPLTKKPENSGFEIGLGFSATSSPGLSLFNWDGKGPGNEVGFSELFHLQSIKNLWLGNPNVSVLSFRWDLKTATYSGKSK